MTTTTVSFSSTAKCIDVLEGLQSLAPVSVACTVTSPPYNIGIAYGSYKDKRPDYLQWMESVFAEIHRVLKDEGHFFLEVGGISTDPLIPYRVLERALKVGWVWQNHFIWVKSVSIGDQSYGHYTPINSQRFVNHNHENIFHLTKTGRVPVSRIAVGVPFVDKSNIARFGHRSDLRCRGDIWYIPHETVQDKNGKYRHPAIFPVALPEMCIRLSGITEGSLVVDPFSGSGSTLVACEKLGMRGIGFDIDPAYVEAANARLLEVVSASKGER